MAQQGILWNLVSGINPLGEYSRGLQQHQQQQNILQQLAGQDQDRAFRRDESTRNQQNTDRSFGFQETEAQRNQSNWQQQFLQNQKNSGASQSIAMAQLRLAQDQFKRGEVPAGFENDPNTPGGLRPRLNGPADPNYIRAVNEEKIRPQNLSAGDITKLSDEGGKFQNLRGFGNTFEDRFGGHTFGTGNLQMQVGRYLPESLAGKDRADASTWWQGYDRYKNQVRNDLFGSALTRPEQEAFDKADIDPSMNQQQIRRNLKIQTDIIASAVQRKAGALVAGGYNPAQIAAAYGLRPNELGVDPSLARSPVAQNMLRGPQQQTQQIQNGTFAVNPQTKQRIQFLNGQWVPAQ